MQVMTFKSKLLFIYNNIQFNLLTYINIYHFCCFTFYFKICVKNHFYCFLRLSKIYSVKIQITLKYCTKQIQDTFICLLHAYLMQDMMKNKTEQDKTKK